MKKSTMIGLVKGNKIQHKKSGLVLTVITVTDEGVQCEEKFISTSNCTRWFDLAPVEEVEQPKEAVEDKTVQPIKPTITEEKTVDDNQPEEHTGDANSKVVEGENTIEQIIQEYKCHTQKMQQYTAVKSDNTKKTLVYIRVAKEGGYHFDISQKTWHKLNKAYANWLTTNFNAGIKDKTRKLYRVSCNDLKIFRNLLLVALS